MGGVRGTASVTEEIMEKIENELHILAYVISNDAKNFLNLIEKALDNGVITTLVINDLKEQDDEIQKKLNDWNKEYPHFKLIDFNRDRSSQITSKYFGTCSICLKPWNVGDQIFYHANPKLTCKDQRCFESNGGNLFQKQILHAKVVVVDRKKAILGSANFSWGGMAAHYEIGIFLEGDEAWTLSKLVDNVADSTKS